MAWPTPAYLTGIFIWSLHSTSLCPLISHCLFQFRCWDMRNWSPLIAKCHHCWPLAPAPWLDSIHPPCAIPDADEPCGSLACPPSPLQTRPCCSRCLRVQQQQQQQPGLGWAVHLMVSCSTLQVSPCMQVWCSRSVIGQFPRVNIAAVLK